LLARYKDYHAAAVDLEVIYAYSGGIWRARSSNDESAMETRKERARA
jgi:hypothetical protein